MAGMQQIQATSLQVSVLFKLSNFSGLDIMDTRNSYIDEEAFSSYFSMTEMPSLMASRMWSVSILKYHKISTYHFLSISPVCGSTISVQLQFHTSYIGTNADEKKLYYGSTCILYYYMTFIGLVRQIIRNQSYQKISHILVLLI